MYSTLINTDELHPLLLEGTAVIVDCRFSLADKNAGWLAYLNGHIPGAIYAHLERDLSGPPVTDRGRHPLPTAEALRALFGRMGIASDRQVVVYDEGSGAYAARLWWLLHYMGHQACAVLNGGWSAYLEAGLPVSSEVATNPECRFDGSPRGERLVTAEEVRDAALLIDSRSQSRYLGEEEPWDAVAGHIPGAVNFDYMLNLTADGRFRPEEVLKRQFLDLFQGSPSEEVVFYCGSGVSACQNLLAQAHAGLPLGKLYAGSWSDWISEPGRPIATGSE